ncbi:uncharacterized protein LOC135349763 [Halichondria panicea]|uniref:uncharacterized protein LOC135349763 n=1 Tax=Halichondria panicea TaxID=6063 RepID=UPI00312BCADB
MMSCLLVLARGWCSNAAGKALSLTVSSLRVDTVAAKGLTISRKRVWECWLEGGLSLNGHPVKKHSSQVGVGDTIELTLGEQGHGRVVVTEIGDRTKKGGYHLNIVRYKHLNKTTQ